MAKDMMEELPFTAEAFEDYLVKQGKGHRNLKYYSVESAIVPIVNDGVLYLGNGYDWNDRFDVKLFNSEKYDYVQFGKCLSVSRSESVAMWRIYAKDKDGCMLDFGTHLSKLVDTLETIDLAIFDKETREYLHRITLNRDQFEIQLRDVLYIEDNDDGSYTVKRSDCRIKAPEELVDSIMGSCKNMCWSYENECRLVVKVPRSVIGKTKFNTAIIQLPESMREALVAKVYRSPLYKEHTLSIPSIPSRLDGNIYFKDCL